MTSGTAISALHFDSRLTTDTVDGLHMEAFAFLQFDLLQIKDFKAAYTTAMVADLASRDTEPLTAVRQLFNSLLSSRLITVNSFACRPKPLYPLVTRSRKRV
ncbi:hypothetical protein D918_03251 [Trichuris suis]|nr:hypothetical protein D918_03251 [Trichuris suis]